MAERSTKLNFKNSLQFTFIREEHDLSHGIWKNSPPSKIDGSASWESESDGYMTGTEGYVKYSMVPNIILEHLYLKWDNPYLGSNSYNSSCDANYEIINFNARGDNATVNFDLRVSPDNVNYPLPPGTYRELDWIPILDVWGEGRIITQENLITGFSNAFNLNHENQKISNGPNKGKEIPNLIPVSDYNNPTFPIKDNVVDFITLMGAPVVKKVVQEMCRVFNKDLVKNPYGLMIFYGISQEEIDIVRKNIPYNMVEISGQRIFPPFNIPNAFEKKVTVFRAS